MINFKFLLFFTIAFLVSCSEDSEKKIEPKTNIDSLQKVKKYNDSIVESKVLVEQLNTNNRFNNITSVLTGNISNANNLNYLFDTLIWKVHATFIDSSWTKLERTRLNAMKEWGRKEFEKPNEETKTVFYPFSGPDYLTVNTFFPNANTYILLGLEPVGKLPEVSSFKKTDAADYAADFKKSLSDIFDKSYFITQRMLNDFQSQKVNGLLPVLSFFIQRTGNQLLAINYLVRYKQDSIAMVAYDYQNPDHKPFGVRIDFLQEGKKKSAYYFKYDVSNKLFNDTTVFYKFINSNTQNCITYIKSASYLLHAHFMSNMRQLILKNSNAIIQDDTGIPFKYFEEESKFDIKLYGQYTKPVSDFPYLSLQKPLQEAFKRDSANVGKLPFHLGYHWGTKKDVIIFAKRK
jgi:hypothetical protein